MAILGQETETREEKNLDLILGHTNLQCQLHAFLQSGVHALIKIFLEEELLFLGVNCVFLPLPPRTFKTKLLITIFI